MPPISDLIALGIAVCFILGCGVLIGIRRDDRRIAVHWAEDDYSLKQRGLEDLSLSCQQMSMRLLSNRGQRAYTERWNQLTDLKR